MSSENVSIKLNGIYATAPENMLKRGNTREEVEEKLQKNISQYLPYEGMRIGIDHLKLSGITIDLGQANIFALGDCVLVYEREIKSEGIDDGLNG